MSGLFRKEVVEKQGKKLTGDVMLVSPVSHLAVTILLTLLVLGIVIFSIAGEYSRKERVFGYLTPDRGLIRLVPRHAGVIEKIHVDAGDTVKKGDQLLSIKIDTMAGDGLSTAETLLEQLAEEKEELLNRLELIPEEYSLSMGRMSEQIVSVRSEAKRLDARIEFQKRLIVNENLVFNKLQNLLLDQAASQLEISSQENRLLQASQTLEGFKNEKQLLVDRAKDLEAQYEMLPISEQKEVSEIRGQLRNVEQRITQTQSQEIYVITAPVAGRLASLTAREGQVTNLQRAVATLLPTGGKLQAELLVPSRAAGFVKEGQTIRLLYDAFPYQKFGFFSGEVSAVSRTVINTNELPIITESNESVFIVTVQLTQQEVVVNNENYQLQSGMTLGADIILEERKIWEWIFEPVLGASKKK